MTFEILELGPLRAHAVGDPGGATVVFLHGFGAPGNDLVSLARVVDAPRPTRFIFPEAPIALPPELFGPGRAWWLIDFGARELELASGGLDLSADDPDGLAIARVALGEALDALIADHGVDPARLVLGGFSQGAMLAADLALESDRPLAGLVLLSGTLLAADRWLPSMATRRDLPVLQSHGRGDPILPFAMAERLRDELGAAGLDVEWLPFSGGHEIPPPVLAALSAKLSSWLAER